MDPLSLISVFAPLFGGLFTNLFNAGQNADSNQMKLWMFNRQMMYNTEMWNKTNEYNTPLAQKQRMLEAGLNPYLGGITPGIASTTPSAPAAANIQPFVASNPLAQFDLNSARLAQGQSVIQQEQAQSQRIQNYISSVDASYKTAKTAAEYDALVKANRGTELGNKYQEMQNQFFEDTKSEQERAIGLQNQLAERNIQRIEKELPFVDKMQAALLNQTIEQTKNLIAGRQLTYVQTKKVLQEELNLKGVLEQMGFTNAQIESTTKYIIAKTTNEGELTQSQLENDRTNRSNTRFRMDLDERRYDNRYADGLFDAVINSYRSRR